MKSEDIVILIGLTPEITDMTQVYKAIKSYCYKKKEIDSSVRFNIILFQENGPNYMEDFTLNPEFILIALKTLNSALIRANIAEGIVGAISSIIEVYKKISEKIYSVLILTDRGSRRISERRMPILEDLIDNIKNLPVFFEMVQIDGKNSDENAKLKKLVKITNGNVHYINKVRKLQSILNKLAGNTDYFSHSSFNKTYKYISEEYHRFFESLAEIPVKVIERSTCSICFQKDEGLVRCPSCETLVHESCWAQWARRSSIGILHVFRCHNCFKLLKLDNEFVKLVHLGIIPGVKEIKIDVINVQEYLESLEPIDAPKIVRVKESTVIDVQKWLESFEADSDPKIIQTDDPTIIKDDNNV